MSPEEVIQDWQPIATAPKDGSHILAFIPDGSMDGTDLIYVLHWQDESLRTYDGQWVEADGEGYATYEPTFWMPLPQHPHKAKKPRQPAG